jgi:CDP-diglyceride synthetase
MAPSLALPSWLGALGGVSFALAVAVLVWRMPHHRDPDDQDPGAVV